MIASRPKENLVAASQPGELAALTLPAHRWGFGAFLLVEVVFLFSAAFIGALSGELPAEAPLPVITVLIGTMIPTTLAAAVALLATVIRGNGPVIDLHISWCWDDIKLGMKFGLYGLVCTSVAAFLWVQLVGDRNATSAIASLVEDQPMSVTAALVMFLYIWLFAPVCEEIIYRGLLWGAVERLGWGKEKWGRIAAFVLSTIIFAISHLEPLRTSLLLVISIPIGLVRLFTGRLPGSIVAHQVNNFFPALAILLASLGLLTQ